MMIFRELKFDAQHDVQVVEVGRMGLTPDGHLWASGAPKIVEMAQYPLFLTFGGSIDPRTEPQKFLENLIDRYHGDYFWVAEEPDDTPLPDLKMIVDFFRLTREGQKNVGTVTLENGVLTATGEYKDIIDSPLECHDIDTGGFTVDPKTEPERFIRELPRQFHGTYTCAIERKEPQTDVAASLDIPPELGDV